MSTKGNPRLIFRGSGTDQAILRELATIRNCTISDLMREGMQLVLIKYRHQYVEAWERVIYNKK